MKTKSIFSKGLIIGNMILITHTASYGLALSDLDNMNSKEVLPPITRAIDSMLANTASNSHEKKQLSKLKKHADKIVAAEHNLDTVSEKKNKINHKLSQITQTGVDKDGKHYSYSGHADTNGPTPEWADIQSKEQEAIHAAIQARQKFKRTADSLDAPIKDKLNEILSHTTAH